MDLSQLSPAEKAHRIKTQNSARQRKFYEANKDKLKETKKKRYKLLTDSLKLVTSDALRPVQPIQQGEHWPKAFDEKLNYNTYEDIMSKLNETDTKNYKSHLNTVFKILNTKNYVTAIGNARTVINKINKAKHNASAPTLYKVNTKKSIFQAIIRTITQLNLPVSQNQFQTYLLEFEALKLDSIEENRKKQEQEPVISFKAYLVKVKEHFGTAGKEWLMASLYNELTLRDDFHLKIVDTAEEADKDKEHQYLILPKNTTQLTIIINKYKTEKKYGPIREQLSKSLSTLIRKYIKSQKIEYGQYLFGNKEKNGPYVTKMNKEMGLTGSVTAYRHMKASEIKFSLTSKQRVQIAARMRHSPLVSLRYVRSLKEEDFVDEEPEDEEEDEEEEVASSPMNPPTIV